MTITELSKKLDDTISCFEQEAGLACQYCSDEPTGDALAENYKATAKALISFKAAILTYLSQF